MTIHSSDWNMPVGTYSVTDGGIAIAGHTCMVNPNRFYQVTCDTLGASDIINIEVKPKYQMSLGVFVRQIQIMSSKHYFNRRHDQNVLSALRNTLSQTEKGFLSSTDPTIGPILNLGYDETKMTDEQADRYRRGVTKSLDSLSTAKSIVDVTAKETD